MAVARIRPRKAKEIPKNMAKQVAADGNQSAGIVRISLNINKI
jgi:hypothetical protein